MYYRSLSIVALCLTMTSLVLAAPAPAKSAPPGDFAQLFGEYKSLLARLAQIKEKYRADPNADKKALETEFEAKIEEGKLLEPKLLAAAEATYLAAPNKDNDVNEYLFASLGGMIQTDDYEKAVKLSRMLLEHKFEHKYFNAFAGLAFFATNDYDDAQKYLKLADESNEIDQNGKRYLGMIDKYKELWAKEQAIRAKEEKADDLPRIKIVTNKGDIVIELFENEAPIATANFINLVEKKFYDGLTFHRVIPGFMAQGGDPKGDGSGGPGYTIPCECFQANHRIHFRGTLSMAHAGRDTGGSQFFLTFVPTSHLDGKHTAFGRIIEGTDVLAKLQRGQAGDASVPDKILKATVLRKRNHKYEPVKRPDKK